MKIIFLEAVQNFGGSSKSTLELAKRLIDENNEVLVVDFWGCCEPYIKQCEKENVPYKLIDPREKPILLSKKGKIDKIINYIAYLKTNQEYKRKLQKIIAQFKPDLISVNNTKTLAILKSSKNYKIAYFSRGWFLPNTFGYIDKRLLKSLVDIYLCVSQATRQMVFASGLASLNDIYVVQGAISQERIYNSLVSNEELLPWHKEGQNSRDFVIMHCGSFIETKGQHVALEVLKRLVNADERVKLLLIGMITPASTSKNYYDSILHSIRENKLESKVEIVLNQSDVLKYFRKVDVLIHPSYSEGLPRVALEAMAFGKPVIANAVGGITDVVIDNFTGFLTNFNAVDEYKEIIQSLIRNKKKYEFFSENASCLINNNYAVENQMNAFMKFQQNINLKE
jgi:glycosyltransferase involved in cell wall biosynthesis